MSKKSNVWVKIKCKKFEGPIKDSVLMSNRELYKLRKVLPKHKFDLFAAYIYAIKQNAQWIYATNGLYPFEAHWLNYASSKLPESGLIFNGDNGKYLFDACKHFSETTQTRLLDLQVRH